MYVNVFDCFSVKWCSCDVLVTAIVTWITTKNIVYMTPVITTRIPCAIHKNLAVYYWSKRCRFGDSRNGVYWLNWETGIKIFENTKNIRIILSGCTEYVFEVDYNLYIYYQMWKPRKTFTKMEEKVS